MDGENIMENPMKQWDDLGGGSTPIFGRPPILQQLHPQVLTPPGVRVNDATPSSNGIEPRIEKRFAKMGWSTKNSKN